MSSPSSVEEQRTTVAVSPEALRQTGRRATFPGGLYREDVMHYLLIRFTGMHIYRYTVGPPYPRLYKRRGPSVNV
jgi:hypothetical protein